MLPKQNQTNILNQDELEVFSSELMDDFQMLETYAGSNKEECTNTCTNNCSSNNIICIKYQCEPPKSSQACGVAPGPVGIG